MLKLRQRKLSREFANALEISIVKSEEDNFNRKTLDIDCVELKGEEIKRFFNMK